MIAYHKQLHNALAQRYMKNQTLQDRNLHHDRLEACLLELQTRRHFQQQERRDKAYQQVLQELQERASCHPSFVVGGGGPSWDPNPFHENLSAMFWTPLFLTLLMGGMMIATLLELVDGIVEMRIAPRPSLSKRSRRQALYETMPRRRWVSSSSSFFLKRFYY
jgi:hypothetical protein